MAEFNVTQLCYRNDQTYNVGEKFECADEDVGKHCDSKALAADNTNTQEAILLFAPDSVQAARISLDRAQLALEKATPDEKKKKTEERKKAAEELARRRTQAAGGSDAIKNKAIGDSFED